MKRLKSWLTSSALKRYNTNEYAMPGMGDGHNGHSFILVDEYGEIQWRADYGRYTMYVPVEILIEQIEQSIEQKNLSSADYAWKILFLWCIII